MGVVWAARPGDSTRWVMGRQRIGGRHSAILLVNVQEHDVRHITPGGKRTKTTNVFHS